MPSEKREMDRVYRSIGASAIDPALAFRDDHLFRLPNTSPPGQSIIDYSEYSLEAASKTVRMLAGRIKEFESQLDERHAVAVFVIGGPSGLTFLPKTIRAQNPDKIVFEGEDGDQQPFVLVQHVSQLNFALRAVKLSKNEVRRPIGFEIPQPSRA